MKTNFSKKLSLNKKTVVDLEMNEVQGGLADIHLPVLTYTKCMTGCPSNDTYPLACCAYC
jgi:hypothetical protein